MSQNGKVVPEAVGHFLIDPVSSSIFGLSRYFRRKRTKNKKSVQIHTPEFQEMLSKEDVDAKQAYIDDLWKQSHLPNSMKDKFYSNPYFDAYWRIKNQDKGHFSNFETLLHGYSKYDQALNDAETKFFGEINALQTEAFANDYDSEQAKADRMRFAGLNPNLLGTGDVSEDYGNPEPVTDMGYPDVNGISDLSTIAGFASPIISAVQSIASVRQMTLQNKLLKQQAKSQGLMNTSEIIDMATDLANDSITADMFKKYKDDGATFLDAAMITGNVLASNFGITNPQDVRAFNQAYNTRLKSIFLHHDSFAAFQDNLANEYSVRSLSYQLENGAPEAQAEYLVGKAKIEAKYAKWEAELMNDLTFEKNWKMEKNSHLKALISESMLDTLQNDSEREAFQQFINSGGIGQMSKEMLQSIKTQIQTELASMKEAELAYHDADSMLQFVTGNKPSDVPRKERRRSRRFARRQARNRYGEAGYMRYWHPGLYGAGLSWLDAGNYD